MKKLLTLATGPRAKWVVLGLWLLIVVGVNAASCRRSSTRSRRTTRRRSSPASAESTKALEATKELQGSERVTMVAVYRRAGGLTAADKAKIAADRAELNALKLPATKPFAPPVLSPRRDVRPAPGGHRHRRRRQDDPGPGREVRDHISTRAAASGEGHRLGRLLGRRDQGLRKHQRHAAVRGDRAGLRPADVIYRCPLFLWIPLVTVVFAEIVAALDRLAAAEPRGDRQRPIVARSCRSSCSARAPTTRCCSSPATARSSAATQDKHEAMPHRDDISGPADLRLGRDRDRRADLPDARRGQRHRGPRADRRDRRRLAR